VSNQALPMEQEIYNLIDMASEKVLLSMSECEKEVLDNSNRDITFQWLTRNRNLSSAGNNNLELADHVITDDMALYLGSRYNTTIENLQHFKQYLIYYLVSEKIWRREELNNMSNDMFYTFAIHDYMNTLRYQQLFLTNNTRLNNSRKTTQISKSNALGEKDLLFEYEIFKQIDELVEKILSMIPECRKEALKSLDKDNIMTWLFYRYGDSFPMLLVRRGQPKIEERINYALITDGMARYLGKKYNLGTGFIHEFKQKLVFAFVVQKLFGHAYSMDAGIETFKETLRK
jgi:hypothetical protein